MNTRIEIEQLKEAFVALETDQERAEFMKQMKLSFDNKTDSEQGMFIIAFEQSAKEACERADTVIQDIEIKIKLSGILDIISMSYIAKKYFNKTKSWFSQRLNGHLVNGVPASFSAEELKILSFALEDISQQLSKTARSIA
ncbi:DUF5053 domain-containing protein [Parabacteroides sp. PF5-6]|uniref:DUF5053 domain-containing protein n=1 Tax=Parabacteroides sp. PF5-6 TaxID=1742403 RepID=UPI002404E395|nr:DUF5053 domain-containing protein [Parabacteroides sp. PF5-6]MDF9831555.1 hypothetical protein [Parabacteroides sp. PF5-6]